MLLIRRFEEKVEERFRAGTWPGSCTLASDNGLIALGVDGSDGAREALRFDAVVLAELLRR